MGLLKAIIALLGTLSVTQLKLLFQILVHYDVFKVARMLKLALTLSQIVGIGDILLRLSSIAGQSDAYVAAVEAISSECEKEA